MKKVILIIAAVSILASLLLSCKSENNEPYIYFRDDNGNILFTDVDLASMKVISTTDGQRGLYIIFNDKEELEKITSKSINKSIRIYYNDELIHSSLVKNVIKGENLLFNDIQENTLEKIEQILKKDK